MQQKELTELTRLEHSTGRIVRFCKQCVFFHTTSKATKHIHRVNMYRVLLDFSSSEYGKGIIVRTFKNLKISLNCETYKPKKCLSIQLFSLNASYEILAT